jgi:hypothetical protein
LTTYVFCEEDRGSPAVDVRPGGRACGGAEGSMAEMAETAEAGHFPVWSRVEETVGVSRRAAGEGVCWVVCSVEARWGFSVRRIKALLILECRALCFHSI